MRIIISNMCNKLKLDCLEGSKQLWWQSKLGTYLVPWIQWIIKRHYKHLYYQEQNLFQIFFELYSAIEISRTLFVYSMRKTQQCTSELPRALFMNNGQKRYFPSRLGSVKPLKSTWSTSALERGFGTRSKNGNHLTFRKSTRYCSATLFTCGRLLKFIDRPYKGRMFSP